MTKSIRSCTMPSIMFEAMDVSSNGAVDGQGNQEHGTGDGNAPQFVGKREPGGGSASYGSV